MKTILIGKGGNIAKIDPEAMTIVPLRSEREGIRGIYMVDEDCVVKYDDDTKEAKAGDLVIVFWDATFNRQFVVVTCEDWVNMLKEYNDKQQIEKEQWALKNSATNDSDNAN